MNENNIRRLRRPGGAPGSPGQRIHANWDAELRCEGRRLRCIVINISSTGASVRVEGYAKPMGEVWLVIDRQAPIAAASVWRRSGRVGLRFHEPQDWVSGIHAKRFDPASWLRNR